MLQHLEGRLPERDHRVPSENLTRRAPRIIGELVGPLLAQEAALAARTHLEWPYMSARKVPYTGRFICRASSDMVNFCCIPAYLS